MNATTVVLIDGSNVARTSAWRRAARTSVDHDLRRRLVDAISSWAGVVGHDVVVAFDGAGPWAPGVVRASAQVEVEGTGAASGDSVLERRARELRTTQVTHWLITSDRALRLVAGAAADRVIDSDSFVAELISAQGAPAHEPDVAPTQPLPGTRVAETLSDDIRVKLERLRRGDR